MFRWGIIFLVIALIAAALGFGGLAGTAAGAAKIVFVVGIILFLVSLFMGRKRRPDVVTVSVCRRCLAKRSTRPTTYYKRFCIS